LLCAVGLCLILYFGLAYDTTVPEYPGVRELEHERVYNLGRMQNRQIGIWVGLGFLGAGVALGIAARNR
jgi:hypothetical protein